MLTFLAQAAAKTSTVPPPNPNEPQYNLLEIVTSVFSRPDALAHPEQLMPHLQSMSMVWAIVFLTGGLVCMLNGYKFYKPVTVVLALLMGASVGYAFGIKIKAEAHIVAGCLGALMAVACMPLMKYAVAVMGGLTGSFIGANAWTSLSKLMVEKGQNGPAPEHAWIGALIGLVIFGMLAFVLFKLSVVMFTSVSGSTLAVMGGMALLLQVPEWRQSVTNGLESHTIIMPMLVMAPALIGLILQQARPDAAPPAAAPAKK